MIVFQASSSRDKMLKRMRMNREYRLQNFGINLNLQHGLENFRRNSVLKEAKEVSDQAVELEKQQVQ